MVRQTKKTCLKQCNLISGNPITIMKSHLS